MQRQNLLAFEAEADFLRDKTILVTGAAGGIGSAVSLAYAACGATVILLDKDVRAMEKLYDAILERGGPEAALYPLNLLGASTNDYDDLANTLEKEFGCLDGLVHCATFLGTRMTLDQYSARLWGEVLQIDLTAPFLLTQACLPLLKKAPAASVVFTSSQAGRQGHAYWGAYGVANAGIENLMQILADELEVNTSVRVNSLDPGAVRTALRNRVYPGEDPATIRPPETVVPAYLYLMSAQSQSETGQQFSV